MQIIRLTMTDSTSWDYSYGLPMIIGLYFILLFLKFKAAFIVDEWASAFSPRSGNLGSLPEYHDAAECIE